MALAQLSSRALVGLDAPPVQVEVHLAGGLPSFSIVGLPEAEVREARERVRSALLNSGFAFPSSRRIVVNLAPAELPKESGRFDLPIALGVLAAAGAIDADAIAGHAFAGELSLSGALRDVRGALAMAMAIAREGPEPTLFVLPARSAQEAALVDPDAVLGATDLAQVVAYLCGERTRASMRPPPVPAPTPSPWPDLADVRGQLAAKRALEIAAAGGHHLLFIGPPGVGKSMLAQRLPGLLPPLDQEAALQSAALASLAGRFKMNDWSRRPFRSPHHTASAAALVGGGGSQIRPGEISLAHEGTLFLDELPEFERRVLDGLREPLESGVVHVSRAAAQAEFPARFQLIAAMNPCPCGHLGDTSRTCRCTAAQVARYRNRISGPLLDRIDLQVELSRPTPETLLALPDGEASTTVAARVEAAMARQRGRQGTSNARLEGTALDRYCALDASDGRWLAAAAGRLGWSGRATHRALRVARTIADLAGRPCIQAADLAEALQFRTTPA